MNNSISRIVALDKWETIQDAISRLSGIPILTTDKLGDPLTRMSGASEYCDAMRHSTSKRRRCKEFKDKACAETIKAGEPKVFTCNCGLVEAVLPVMDGASCCGMIVLGMVRLKDGGEEFQKPGCCAETCAGCEEVSPESVPEVEYSKLMDTLELVRVTFETLENVHRMTMNRGLLSSSVDKREIPTLPNVPKDSPIYRAVKYFDTRLDEQVSMKRMAQLCQLSESYFSKLFVRETGMSFVDWANDRKMQWAKCYIENTKTSVRDIAAALGFNDTSYFIKVFKKYCGITPLGYRHEISNREQ